MRDTAITATPTTAYTFKSDEEVILIQFRVYDQRDETIRALILYEDHFNEVKISTKSKQIYSEKRHNYHIPMHRRSAGRVKIGCHSKDKNFRKMDYTIYDNIFEIMDAAYFREFYILHNRHGIAVANGLKRKLLIKFIFPPIKQISCNFMDKEQKGLYLLEFSAPIRFESRRFVGFEVEPILRLGQIQAENGPQNGEIDDFKATVSGGELSKVFSTHERKVILELAFLEVLGIEEHDIRINAYFFSYGSLIIVHYQPDVYFLAYSSEKKEFEQVYPKISFGNDKGKNHIFD